MADTEGDLQTQRIQRWKKPWRSISPAPNLADEETEVQDSEQCITKAIAMTILTRTQGPAAHQALSHTSQPLVFFKDSGPTGIEITFASRTRFLHLYG